MRNSIDTRERGFTLIEMSIVLIIIGLIIGGILKGQELIESARQKNFISQIDSVKAGTNSFYDRFASLPGDYGTAPCAACVAGNDNGELNAPAAVTTAATLASFQANQNENYEYWNHLMGAGFLGGGAAALAATGGLNFSGGANPSPLPTAAFPQSGLTIVYGTHQGAAANADSRRTNWIRAARYGTTTIITAAEAIIAPTRALQMDTKYDDGRPDTGQIRTTGLANGVASSCGGPGAAGGSYLAAESSVQCSLLIALD